MRYLTQLARILVGGLFIFSGLIKLNDPLGFSYKLDEYFSEPVLNLPFLQPLALALSLVLVISEVLLGLALLLGFRKHTTSLLLLLMIVFFTFLTFYSAYFNKVTDCGCFGDAIPLTPWESFYKDVILTVLILVVFFNKRYIKPLLPANAAGALVGLALLACGYLGYYVLAHLPLRDFRPYAEGKSIVEGMKSAEEVGERPTEYATIYTLKNRETGEEIEVSSDVYIAEKWYEKKEEWEMLNDRSRSVVTYEGYEPPVHDFMIMLNDEDITQRVLSLDAAFLLVSYDFTQAEEEAFEKINAFAREAEQNEVFFLGATATLAQETEQLRHDYQMPFPMASMDATTLKTIVRANPGIVLLKNGRVVKKWHHHDLPTFSEVQAAHL